jgi:hypothetical protein
MPYVTGGAAFGNIQASTPGLAQTSSDNSGWTLGAGLEAALHRIGAPRSSISMSISAPLIAD